MKTPLSRIVACTLFIILIQSALGCHEHLNYKRCDVVMSHPELGLPSIPVFFYHSQKPNLDRKQEYIVFLHGRGYSRDINAPDSMLEHMGIAQILSDERFSHLVFIAPQDIVIQKDDQRRGQDYWIGDESRDWVSFLGDHLPNAIGASHLTLLGVSMGAHGALLTSSFYPEEYNQIIALSPIFRPVKDEIESSDYDIFFRSDREPNDINVGSLLLENNFDVRPKTFISISSADFGLDRSRFPKANESWKNLLPQHDQKNNIHISISADDRGHSMTYWRDSLIQALDWLLL